MKGRTDREQQHKEDVKIALKGADDSSSSKMLRKMDR